MTSTYFRVRLPYPTVIDLTVGKESNKVEGNLVEIFDDGTKRVYTIETDWGQRMTLSAVAGDFRIRTVEDEDGETWAESYD
jgi:hypothetical protein